MLAYLRIIGIGLLTWLAMSGAMVAPAMADGSQNSWESATCFWYDLAGF
jgi:hypothetical protein